MKKPVVFRDLGHMDYKACWDLQETYFNTSVQQKLDNRNKTPEEQVVTTDHLFFVEHLQTGHQGSTHASCDATNTQH